MKTLISDLKKYMLFTLHSKVHTVWSNQMGIVFYGDIVLQSFDGAFRYKHSFSNNEYFGLLIVKILVLRVIMEN